MFAEKATQMSLMFRSGNEGSFKRSGISIASRHSAITRDQVHPPEDIVCASHPYRSMFTAVVYLEDHGGSSIWCDGHCSEPLPRPQAQPDGTLGIHDRSYRWQSRIRGTLDCVQFHFPKAHLEKMAGGTEGQGVELLEGRPARLSLVDPLLKCLALASLPLLDGDIDPGGPYAEQVMDAVVSHIARTYCRLRSRSTFDRDRLASWQLQKISSIVAGNIEDRISVDDLARACTLSPSHFSYLFKNTTGSTPHQWLLNRRIELAKQLLLQTREPLATIASASGFADQSHFTRVFSRRVKASPSVWRRSEHARVAALPPEAMPLQPATHG